MAAAAGLVASARSSKFRGGLVAGALLLMAGILACLIGVADRGEGLTAHDGEARSGDFAYVVHRVEVTDVLADPEFPDRNVTAAGRFVVVKMTVTNVGNEPQTFFASFNTLSDGSTVYQSDDEAWIYLGNTLADLNPGDSVDTAVVFDVPRGTDVESIELHDGPFSDGVTVGL